MEPILLRTKEAAKLCGITAKTWRSWSQFGKTPRPLVIGKLHFWRYEELVEWVAAGCPNRKDWKFQRTSKIEPLKRHNTKP